MAVQELDPVQRAFVNETVRPFLEKMVWIVDRLDTFGADYDNQQNAIAITGDDLGDGVDGLVPRTDAPVITGTHLGVLRSIVTGMRGGMSQAQLDILISLLVRDLSRIRAGGQG